MEAEEPERQEGAEEEAAFGGGAAASGAGQYLADLPSLGHTAISSSAARRQESAEATPSNASCASRAAQYLANLPSRGLFSSTVISSNLGGIRVYVCDHDTAPPGDQVIKTDPTNILIRALQLNNEKKDRKDVSAKTTNENKGKRSAARTLENKAPAKRLSSGSASGTTLQEGSSNGLSEKTLQRYTVERLRSLLKEKGLSSRGRKDELIARLLEKDA